MTEIKTGTIYKISTEKSDKVYVGSTTTTLNHRLRNHKCRRTCMSKELLELGECKIEALEVLYNCTKRELLIKEQFYLDLLKEKVVNKKPAYRTKEEKKEKRKEKDRRWRENNKEKIKVQNENYRLNKKSNSEAV